MRSKLGKWLITVGYRFLLPDERAHWDQICALGMQALVEKQKPSPPATRLVYVPVSPDAEQQIPPTRH